MGTSHSMRSSWLDKLPFELCLRIASHVTGGQLTEDALHLAQVSPCQRNAVLTSISQGFNNISLEWAELFLSNPSAFEDYNEIFHFSHLNQHHYPRMFKTHMLRRVSLSDDPNLFIAASRSKCIQELDLEITEHIPRQVVFYLLSALKIKKLTLRCRAWWEYNSVCFFQDPKFFNQDRNALAESCPYLESVHVDCLCQEEDPPFWKIFPGLQSLSEVKCRSPTKEVMQEVRNLASVKLFDLIDGHEAFQDAIRVGPAVTELCSYGRLYEEDIHELKRCPRLSMLHCTIAEGAESSLIEAARSLSVLKELQVHWHTPWEIDMDEDLPSYEIEEGALPVLVRAIPSMTNLRLSHIKVPLDEVLEIQRMFGQRLEVFEVHVMSDEDEPLQCLAQILHTASEHNPRIRTLLISGAGLSEAHEECNSDNGKHARKALAALHRLQRRAPSFMWMSLEKTLGHILKISS